MAHLLRLKVVLKSLHSLNHTFAFPACHDKEPLGKWVDFPRAGVVLKYRLVQDAPSSGHPVFMAVSL